MTAIKFIVRDMHSGEDLSDLFDSYDDANCYMAEMGIDRDTPDAGVDTIEDPDVCGYCGTSDNPNDICKSCWNSMRGE